MNDMSLPPHATLVARLRRSAQERKLCHEAADRIEYIEELLRKGVEIAGQLVKDISDVVDEAEADIDDAERYKITLRIVRDYLRQKNLKSSRADALGIINAALGDD